MPKRVTIKDVAASAGVSYQTVSKVLNGTISVTKDTEERIWTAVNELNYRPNQSARSLRSQKTQMIGYSWGPNAQDDYNAIMDNFFQGMISTAERLDYYLLFFPHAKSGDRISHYQKLIDTGRVDGFILSNIEYNDPRISFLSEKNFPFVSFGRPEPGFQTPSVDVDGKVGIQKAAVHLIENQHTKIAALAWDELSRVGNDRLEGYFSTMEQYKLPVHEEWIVRCPGVYEAGFEQTISLLSLPEAIRPTAIVALNDQMAIGAAHAVIAKGLQVGEDIAVTGFDGIPSTKYTSPTITTLKQPTWEIGQTVVQMLIKILNQEELDEQSILLEPELVIRESSRRNL